MQESRVQGYEHAANRSTGIFRFRRADRSDGQRNHGRIIKFNYSLSWTQLIIERETCCFPEKEVWNHANQRPKRHASPRDQVVVLRTFVSNVHFFFLRRSSDDFHDRRPFRVHTVPMTGAPSTTTVAVAVSLHAPIVKSRTRL